MTPKEIMTAFAIRGPLPREALEAAGQMRSEMLPEFLGCIERLLAADIDTASDDDVSAFLFVFHLLGEWREQSAYRPLTLLLRQDPDLVEALIGDGITETSGRVIAGVFDGDLLPLFEVIGDTAADSFIRGQMFDAMVISTLADPGLKPQVIGFLKKFFDENDIDTHEEIWSAWASAVAALGASDLKPLVAQVYADQRISPLHSTFDFFEKELQTTLQTGTPKRFTRRRHADLISDAAEELSHWYCFSDDYLNPKPKPPRTDNRFSRMLDMPYVHATPKIGRNDLCPCGSGKKFKKCCLH